MGCLFGGGTAIVLRYGEFRESLDIDFLVSDRGGYRELRRRLAGSQDLKGILRADAELELVREVRADQYGIRTIVEVSSARIKMEIISEGRIDLEPPSKADRICGIPTLSPLDMATSKLLANSDRWFDDSVLNRDLIDLAMMEPKLSLLRAALGKAHEAYESVERDLHRAIERLGERNGRLEVCKQQLRMTVPTAVLWKRIKALRGSRARGL